MEKPALNGRCIGRKPSSEYAASDATALIEAIAERRAAFMRAGALRLALWATIGALLGALFSMR